MSLICPSPGQTSAKISVEQKCQLNDENSIYLHFSSYPTETYRIIRDEVTRHFPFGGDFNVQISMGISGRECHKKWQYRFFSDFRSLNNFMNADRTPLPNIEEVFEDFREGTFSQSRIGFNYTGRFLLQKISNIRSIRAAS